MNSEYLILAIVAVMGIGGGLYWYGHVKRQKMKERPAEPMSYEQVQAAVDRRVKWVAVIAALISVLGLVAVYLLK